MPKRSMIDVHMGNARTVELRHRRNARATKAGKASSGDLYLCDVSLSEEHGEPVVRDLNLSFPLQFDQIWKVDISMKNDGLDGWLPSRHRSPWVCSKDLVGEKKLICRSSSLAEHAILLEQDLCQLVTHLKQLVFLDLYGKVWQQKVELYRDMLDTRFPNSRHAVNLFRLRLWLWVIPAGGTSFPFCAEVAHSESFPLWKTHNLVFLYRCAIDRRIILMLLVRVIWSELAESEPKHRKKRRGPLGCS